MTIETRAETETLLKLSDVLSILAISRTTLWRRVQDGSLPGPLKIAGVMRWRRSEVMAALEDASAQRRPVKRKLTPPARAA